MFQKVDMSIGAWFVYHILMLIPVVNIIIFILLLVDPKTNTSLKNLMLFQVIIVAVVIVFWVLVLGSIVGNLALN